MLDLGAKEQLREVRDQASGPPWQLMHPVRGGTGIPCLSSGSTLAVIAEPGFNPESSGSSDVPDFSLLCPMRLSPQSQHGPPGQGVTP